MGTDNNKEIRSLFKADELDALSSLFKITSGNPPKVTANRFRADHPEWMSVLDKLEHQDQLIERTKGGQFYLLRPYSLVLIEGESAKRIINYMEELFLFAKDWYLKNLNEPITVEKILTDLNSGEDIVKSALYYFSEIGGVWAGKGNGFPYTPESELRINEQILTKNSVVELLKEYFEWNYINRPKTKIYMNDLKIEAEAPRLLKHAKWYIENYPRLFNRHNIFIVIVAGFIFLFVLSIQIL